ncbi:hypothetical protein DUNSADRAFT_10127, partial [Dunaliella salina]
MDTFGKATFDRTMPCSLRVALPLGVSPSRTAFPHVSPVIAHTHVCCHWCFPFLLLLRFCCPASWGEPLMDSISSRLLLWPSSFPSLLLRCTCQAPAGEPLMTRISRASRKPKKQSSIRAEHQSREPSVHRRRDSEGEVEPSSREGPKLNAEVFEIKCTDGANEDITMFKYRNELGSLSQGAAGLQGHNSQQLPVVSVPMPTDVTKVPVDVSAVALGVYRLK